jgi:hypothetical protein
VTRTVKAGLASTSQPLDRTTRGFMERRFGWDFSRIRVHADPTAARSALALGARAYTVGNDIVFGANAFHPTSSPGRSLLAHELAHSMQQRGSSAHTISELGPAHDAIEVEADRLAARALSASPATPAPTVSSDAGAALRRAPIPVWGGKFDIGKKGYTETYQVAGEQDRPDGTREKTVRPGVVLDLTFAPDPAVVDAEEISFVQSATTLRNNQPHFINKTVESRSIPAGDLGEGTHIDQFPTEKSPFLKASTGAHFKDAKKETTGEAETIDNPGFEVWDSDSAEMDLTTAAVATKGKQTGAFYGAVRWGWTREPRQPTKKIELGPTSSPLPGGSLFKTIAGLWDASKTSGKQATEHLPAVAVKYTKKSTRLVPDPARSGASGAVSLDVNTEVQVTETVDPTNKGWLNVIVTSGRYAGRRGWVHEPLDDVKGIVPKSRARH